MTAGQITDRSVIRGHRMASHSRAPGRVHTPPTEALTLVEQLTADGVEGAAIARLLRISEADVVRALIWCVQLNREAVSLALEALSAPVDSDGYQRARTAFLAVLGEKRNLPGGL